MAKRKSYKQKKRGPILKTGEILYPSTARLRLIKTILFSMLNDLKLNECFHCQEPMKIEELSIEHKTPWLHADDEEKLYFDLKNVTFSHISCNSSVARKPHRPYVQKFTKLTQPKKRRCWVCKKFKKHELFKKEKREKTGRSWICKCCHNKKQRDRTAKKKKLTQS
jgi:hypothetical protein